jgi:murein DD-endopeptidase MepM/ murein hydrolase activator NlpD
VPHRAEIRSGRHRRHRHRAPRPVLPGSVAAILAGERGRKALLTAALSGALIAGVAGGTAAAAADEQVPAGVTTVVTITADAPRQPVHAVDPETVLAPELTPNKTEPEPPVFAAGGLGATPTRLKPKAKPPAAAPARAAWVNPLSAGHVTSCFGPRWGREHQGVDLAAPHGTPVVAAGAGVVVRAGELGGYGIAVLIDHGNGFLTHYGHLSALTVQPGDRVATGRQIGNEGSTGHSTGPHLHFEVHRDYFKNPLEPTAWLHNRGVDISGC